MITNCNECTAEVEDDDILSCEACGADCLCEDCHMNHICEDDDFYEDEICAECGGPNPDGDFPICMECAGHEVHG